MHPADNIYFISSEKKKKRKRMRKRKKIPPGGSSFYNLKSLGMRAFTTSRVWCQVCDCIVVSNRNASRLGRWSFPVLIDAI
jgi:hypothetical protein